MEKDRLILRCQSVPYALGKSVYFLSSGNDIHDPRPPKFVCYRTLCLWVAVLVTMVKVSRKR